MAARKAFGTAIVASPLAYYLISTNSGKPRSSRTGEDVDESCRRLNLPTPAKAQTVDVLHSPNLISKDEVRAILAAASKARARGLLGYVERRGESGRSKVGGDWRTTYMHSGNFFHDKIMDTEDLMGRIIKRVKERADKGDEGWAFMRKFLENRDSLNFRTIELHEYGPGGGLPEKKHYDAGSIITIDAMLCDGDKSFEGGMMYCPIYDLKSDEEEDDDVVIRRNFVKPSDGFNSAGDAILFPSHKFRNVSPITGGKRVVMVLEIWEGEAKTCFHRCLKREKCDYDEKRFQQAELMKTVCML